MTSERGTTRHVAILALSAGIVAAAFLLEDCGRGRVEVRFLPGATLPHACGMRAWLGVDCPACGLTRSFIHLAEGDLHASLASHRLGWLAALFVLLQWPYRVAALRRGDGRPLGRVLPRCAGYGLIALLLANWCLARLVA